MRTDTPCTLVGWGKLTLPIPALLAPSPQAFRFLFFPEGLGFQGYCCPLQLRNLPLVFLLVQRTGPGLGESSNGPGET